MPEGGKGRRRGGAPNGPRPFWSGTIAFGLVTLPVSLFAAHRSGRPSLRMIGPQGTPLERRYFCTREGVPLGRDDIVRGYPLGDGEYVVMTDAELDRLAPERSREIDLKRFVDLSEIDPIYFDRAYFLAPESGAIKAYRLLARAMEDSERAGIASFVMRGTEYLVAILAEGGILRAETLRFAQEVRSAEQVGLPRPDAPDGLVDEIEAALADLPADPPKDALNDRDAERLRDLVDRKLTRDEDVVAAPGTAEPEGEAPVDLMRVLKASLRAGGPNAAGGDGLTDLTKRELYERAQDRDIEGRSQMTKAELIDALEG